MKEAEKEVVAKGIDYTLPFTEEARQSMVKYVKEASKVIEEKEKIVSSLEK